MLDQFFDCNEMKNIFYLCSTILCGFKWNFIKNSVVTAAVFLSSNNIN